MNDATIFNMFAVSQPGVERITALELNRLGIDCTVIEGGVTFRGSLAELYQANLWLRTANRILVRVGNFRISELSQVTRRLARYPWELYGIGRGNSPDIRVTCHKSRLWHTGAVAQRALRGIEQRTGTSEVTAAQEAPAPMVTIRIVRDQCTLSIDSSGLPLHMRGYRKAGVKAPLRENLAAALIMMSAWKPGMPLLDPLCGSGTIAIEAAMIGMNMAPGANRKFAFMKWKNSDAELWDRVLKQALKHETHSELAIFARDADHRAVEASGANAEAAGVTDYLNLEQAVVSAATRAPVSHTGWVVTNPPYGRRISAKQKHGRDIYRKIAEAMRNGLRGWGITCLAPSARNNPLPGLKVQTLSTFLNGGFRVRAVQSQSLT